MEIEKAAFTILETTHESTEVVKASKLLMHTSQVLEH